MLTRTHTQAHARRTHASTRAHTQVLEANEQDYDLRRGSYVPLKQPLAVAPQSSLPKPPPAPKPSPANADAEASPSSRTSASTDRPLDLALYFERLRVGPLVPAAEGNAAERATALVAHALGVESAPPPAEALVTQLRRRSGCDGKAHFVVYDEPLWLVSERGALCCSVVPCVAAGCRALQRGAVAADLVGLPSRAFYRLALAPQAPDRSEEHRQKPAPWYPARHGIHAPW